MTLYTGAPRGGFGDTAASLLMIERLAEVYRQTNTTFQVVFPDEAIEQIHTLWPDFKIDVNEQLVRGILFSRMGFHKPADVVLSFSAMEGALEGSNLGKLKLTYLEYEEQRAELGSNTFRAPVRDYRLNTVIKSVSINEGPTFNTGFGNGIYVMDGFRPEDFSKEATFRYLNRFAPDVRFSNEAKLAYAYTSSPKLAQQYVNALEKLARNGLQEIVCVTNQPVVTNSPMVKIISMKGLPFNLNQKVIKSSDLPILVTGDGSLSLAIEGRKTFFYSMYAWKRFTPNSLRKEIESVSPMLKRNRQLMDTVSELLRLDISGTRYYEDMFLSVMENVELQNELRRVYDIFVKQDSLVDMVQKDIAVFKSLNPHFKNESFGNELRLFWILARKAKSLDAAIKKTELMLFESKKDPAIRLRRFLALSALTVYPRQKFADVLSQALLHGDIELKSTISYVFQDNYKVYNLKEIYPLLSTEAKQEFKNIFVNLSAQDPQQWGSHAKGGQNFLETLIAIDTQTNSCHQFYKGQ